MDELGQMFAFGANNAQRRGAFQPGCRSKYRTADTTITSHPNPLACRYQRTACYASDRAHR